MMYQKEYAIAVIQNGKIVPEQNGGVTLPYGSEYQIRLKNKSRQRSIADIYIDGNIACKGLIVDEDGTVDLERYIRPNIDSMTGGPKFKLARLNHPGVADAGDSQNGLLEVRFYKEAVKPKPQHIITTNVPPCQPWAVYNHGMPYYTGGWYFSSKTVTRRGKPVPCSCDNSDPGVFSSTCDYLATKGSRKIGEVHEVHSDYMMCDRGPTLHTKGILRNAETKISAQAADGPAATVQGGFSRQSVQNVNIEVDTTKFESLSLKLFGVTRITRMEKCPSCNHKRKNNEKFCPSCGTALVIEG